jgi:hypothetical protein
MKIVKYFVLTALFIVLVGIIACNPATQTGQPSGDDRETAQSPDTESSQPVPDNAGTGEGRGLLSPAEEGGSGAVGTNEQIGGVASPSGPADAGTGENQIVTVVLPDGSTVVWNYSDDKNRMADLNLPEGWPSDVPVMQGFELHDGMSSGAGTSFISIMGSGDVTAENVKSYYSHLPGWVFDQDLEIANAPEGLISFTMKKDTITLTVSAGPVPQGGDRSKGNLNLSLSVSLGQ